MKTTQIEITPECLRSQGLSEVNTLPKSLIGHKFGTHTVLEFSHFGPKYRRYWISACGCGKKERHREDYLKSGLPSCRECRRRMLKTRNERKCSGCKLLLPMGRFHKDATVIDGRRRYCKKCSSQIAN